MASYPGRKEGEWFHVQRRGHKLMCCDCGLVHTLNLRIVHGRIELQTFRNRRATAASGARRRGTVTIIAQQKVMTRIKKAVTRILSTKEK